MKPGAPWSIKGIDPEAREAAKEKAKAAGMTLGQWLNSTITGAGEAAPAAAPAAPAPGASALDTARIMRAIAELARRVDQVGTGGQGGGDTSAIQSRLNALDQRLTVMSEALPGSQPSFDQARLERGLVTIARRIEAVEKGRAGEAESMTGLRNDIARLEQGIGQASAPPPAPDLSSVETGLARLEQRLNGIEAQVAESASRDSSHTAAPAIDESQIASLNENIRKLMNGMINLGAKVDQMEQKVSQKIQPLENRVSGLQGHIDSQREADRASMDEAFKRVDRQLAERPSSDTSPDVQAAVQAAIAPLVHQLSRQTAAESREPQPVQGFADQREVVEPPRAEPEPELVAETPPEPAFEPAPNEAQEGGIGEATRNLAPEPTEPEPEPGRAAALNDLTNQPTLQAPVLDDGEFFRDFEPPKEPEPEAEQEPEPAAAAPEASEPEPRPTIDEPERPEGLLPVEQLLADTEDRPAPARPLPPQPEPEDREPEPAAAAMASGAAAGRSFRLDEPLDLSRQPPPEPMRSYPGRRAWLRYLIIALIFLALLIGGFWFVGTPQFRDLSQKVSVLWDDAMVGIQGIDADGETPDGGGTATPAPEATESEGATAPQAAVEPTPAPVPAPEPAAPAPEPAPAAPVTPEPEPEPQTVEPAAEPNELDQLIAKANSGDAEAQYEMGVRTRDGIGVEPDYSIAADWFDQAAQQGHVQAQLGLGVMYRQGLGRAQDLDLAKLWLHAAARAGNADAQKYLGEVYVDDRSGVPDYFQAARWFREAAEQGLVDAQYNMGVLYEGGLGVPRDPEQAYYWFGLALKSGDSTAREDLQRVGAQLTPEQRAEIESRTTGFSPAGATAALPAPALPSEGPDAILTRRDQVRLLQELLIARGYDPGTPDGIPGAKTREAIAQWQQDSGLEVRGQITESVLRGLQ